MMEYDIIRKKVISAYNCSFKNVSYKNNNYKKYCCKSWRINVSQDFFQKTRHGISSFIPEAR